MNISSVSTNKCYTWGSAYWSVCASISFTSALLNIKYIPLSFLLTQCSWHQIVYFLSYFPISSGAPRLPWAPGLLHAHTSISSSQFNTFALVFFPFVGLSQKKIFTKCLRLWFHSNSIRGVSLAESKGGAGGEGGLGIPDGLLPCVRWEGNTWCYTIQNKPLPQPTSERLFVCEARWKAIIAAHLWIDTFIHLQQVAQGRWIAS